MRSMTGYGSGSAAAPEHNLKILTEITSVNRKSLDLNLSGPKQWTGFDRHCSDWLKGHFERGRVQIQIKVTEIGGNDEALSWNEALVGRSLDRLERFARARNLTFEPDAQLLFQISQSLKETAGLPDWKELEAALKSSFEAALADINRMREKEGGSLRSDLEARIQEMAGLVSAIEDCAAEVPKNIKAKLLERLTELGLTLDLEDERVLKEVALFADRADISEELTRLKSHFEQFLQLIEEGAPCGRKLDFLCQEIHREFNTTGSKANHIAITRAVIEGKNALERVREQVQNVE